MITILDVASACSDPGLASILMIVKSMVTMIQIIAPLLLIVMLAIHFIRLVKNPDEKKIRGFYMNAFASAWATW